MSSPQAQTTAAPPAQSAATQMTPVIPFPIGPVNVTPNPTGAVLGLIAVVVFTLLVRTLWRLPQILELRDSDLIARFGGSYAVQNHMLRGLGYAAIVLGIGMGNALGGLVLAILIMIAVNVRYDGRSAPQPVAYEE
jgi:hypothetical protein